MAAENCWEKAISMISRTDELELPANLSSNEIADAFKQALTIDSQEVVGRLGVVDRFMVISLSVFRCQVN
jgi:hypothetical protein